MYITTNFQLLDLHYKNIYYIISCVIYNCFYTEVPTLTRTAKRLKHNDM